MASQLEVTLQRFWRYVDRSGGPSACWPWTGGIRKDGYARFWDGQRAVLAHRFAYEALIGAVPDGRELDHVKARGCHSRSCVNVFAHIEPVTKAENMRRGNWNGVSSAGAAQNRAKAECPSGHAYDELNTYFTPAGHRKCRTCGRVRDALRRPVRVVTQ